MNSNMLAGERRWASSRRGGMTVLGKVAVPKPLNLPSQRLENHGLDPSVEIVPKGTLSWGSRPSSSGSNAWHSSSLSSNADGGNTSPSHLGGRPSSGGTGTRPSTAGSDKTHEPIAGAWGPNSRPSSASGTLTSNQSSSSSLRPRSAETRPNSSQLSRFAEPLSESSVAWAPSSIAERLGVKSSKEDGFSLSSGDFPTLGSEKDNSVKNFESQSDNGRPISASSRTTSPKEDNTNLADAKRGMVNTWRVDGPQMAGDGIHPSMENWQGERQQYFNANVPPQHFDSWRGPPFNVPASVWYGGPPQGPPFRVPGGFPIEPFPYYRPQVPPAALGGSHQAPPPGSGPRGLHPQHGEFYRPQMHDSYARPGPPFRPGFYAGPPGPMSYYGPPMGYCNNERDIQYMGIAAGPPVHGGYPGQNAPDMVTSHVRAGGRDVSGKTMPEDMKADHLEDTLGSRQVPKNYNEWDRKADGENWEHEVPNVLHPGKNCLPMIKSRTNEWGTENDAEEDMFAKSKTPSVNSSHHSHSFLYRDPSSDIVKVKSFESMGNVKQDDDSWTKKVDSVATYPPAIPQLPLVNEGDELLLSATKDPALMQKIEGLNAKVRASDGRNDALNAYNREEQWNRSHHIDLKNTSNSGPGEFSNTAGFSEKAPGFGDFVPVLQGVGNVSDKSIQPVAAVSRRSYHGGQVRVDHCGKGKFNNQDTDGWQRKLLTHESSSAVTASNIESESGIHAHGPSFVGEATGNSVTNPVGKTGESVAETFDSTDIQAKRAKRELAKQRALKLQREEDERIKEQKAKALAKLEELDRRTQAGEVANPVAEKIQAISDIQGEQQESRTICDPVTDHLHFEAPCTNRVSEPCNAYVVRESSTSKAGNFVAEVSRNLQQDMSQTGLLESDVSHGHHVPIKEDTQAVNARNDPSQRNQNNLSQKSSNAKSVPVSVSTRQNDSHAAAVAVDITRAEVPSSEIKSSSESNVHKISNTVAVPQRKKVNKSTKNKYKTEPAPSLPTVISDTNHEKKLSENSESKALLNMDSSISKVIEPEMSQGYEMSSLLKEESQSGVTNHRRPQPVRRNLRSQQGNRYTDKVHGSEVVWAPVRTQSKPEDSIDASQKSTPESANNPTVAQCSFKGKRAEMERYIPKPVAKDLAQQVNISSSTLDEAHGTGKLGSVSPANPQPVSSSIALIGSNVEIKEADGRHNKHKKEHGQWKQLGKTDSSHTRPSPISEAIRERGGLEKSDKDPEIKGSGIVNSGKRHMARRPRSSGNSVDHENIPEVNQTDQTVNSKENQSFGEQQTSSQWKSKSRPNSANNQHGNKTAGSETLTTEINKLPKNDLPQQHKAPQLVFGSIVADDSIVSHHLGLNRENKSAAPTTKERPYSPNQDQVLSVESTPAGNTDSRNERNMSGSGRNGQNSRFTRGGYESRGDRSSGQDNRMRNVPALHERQRQNVQYEYHPVRHGKGDVPENFDEADGANNGVHRYRGRGQSQQRRGENYYRRQGGGQEY